MFDAPTSAEWSAVILSLEVGLAATAGAFPFGLITAWALARWHFPGKALLSAVVTLPLVIPPVVVGYALLVLFGRNGAFGEALAAIGVRLPFSWGGAVLAAAVMGFPLMVRAIRLSLEAVSPEYEEAAATLGAPPLRRILTVTLPLAMPGLISGALLAFARALGEFGATITFAGNIPGETRTVPLAIYTLLQTPGGDVAVARLAILSVIVALAALLAGEWLARRTAPRREERGS
jgi:molybdate transport system permease protein